MNAEGDSVHVIEARRAELEILLAEYKAHYDEVYKWHSYRHQALGGYFVVLSILATLMRKNRWEAWAHGIPIVLALLSVILLYILFQYRFAIVRNVIYIHSHIAPRLRRLSTDKVLDDLQVCQTYRDSSYSMRALSKFGIEIVAYIVFLGSLIWYLGWFACEDCGNLSNALSIREFSPPAASLFLMFVSPAIVFWIGCSFRRLSDDEKGADKFGN